MTGKVSTVRFFWVLVALSLAAAQGCSGAPKLRPNIGVGVGLDDLPADYSIVIGRTRVTLGGAPLPCAYVHGQPECSLALTYDGRQKFLVPYQSDSRPLALGAEAAPFFVLRLPKGAYEVTHFESSGGKLPSRYDRGSGGAVPLGKRFSVGEREILYVGSLFVEIKMADSRNAGAPAASMP